MFPLNQGSELSFEAAAEEVESYHQDLILDNDLLAAVNLYTSSSTAPTQLTPPATADKGKGRARGRKAGGGGGGGGGAGVSGFEENDHSRKMAHRDIERQRRHEMSALFSNLRSFLPLDYLKQGKRSMSDHIAETVNYIKHLEGRIEDLGERREQLTRGAVIRDELIGTSTINPSACNVEVFNLGSGGGGGGGGVHVQISTGGGDCLSRALKVLVEAGLDVVSCISNHVNGTLLHNIHCLQLQPQVIEMERNADIDMQQLQQRLYQVVVCSSTSH